MVSISVFSSKRLIALIGLTVTLWVTGACTTLRETIGLGPVRPTVRLQAIEVQKVTTTTVVIIAVLRVDNPNDFALTFRNLTYRLDAGELELAVGNYHEDLRIPAEHWATVNLPITVNAVHAMKIARLLIQSEGELMTDLRAKADFVTPFGDIEVKFEEKRPLAKLAGF